MDRSEIVGRNSLGEDIYHVTIDQSELPRQYRDAGLIYGKQLGHLLFVSTGGRIMYLPRGDWDGEISVTKTIEKTAVEQGNHIVWLSGDFAHPNYTSGYGTFYDYGYRVWISS